MGSFRFGSFVAGASCALIIVLGFGGARQPPTQQTDTQKKIDAELWKTHGQKPASKDDPEVAAWMAQRQEMQDTWDKMVLDAQAVAGDHQPIVSVVPKGGWVFVVTPAGRAYCVDQTGFPTVVRSVGIGKNGQHMKAVERDFNFRLDMGMPEIFDLFPEPKNGP